MVCDHGIIVDGSDRWFALFRCRREDAIGRPVMSFTAPSVVPMALQLIEAKWAEPYEVGDAAPRRHDLSRHRAGPQPECSATASCA